MLIRYLDTGGLRACSAPWGRSGVGLRLGGRHGLVDTRLRRWHRLILGISEFKAMLKIMVNL